MAGTFSPQQLSAEALGLIAGRFAALSEVARLKLIIALEDGEKNVAELVAATGQEQTTVSRQLKHLVTAGVHARRRDGVRVYYSIADPAIFDLCRHVCGSLQRHFLSQAKTSGLFKL